MADVHIFNGGVSVRRFHYSPPPPHHHYHHHHHPQRCAPRDQTLSSTAMNPAPTVWFASASLVAMVYLVHRLAKWTRCMSNARRPALPIDVHV